MTVEQKTCHVNSQPGLGLQTAIPEAVADKGPVAGLVCHLEEVPPSARADSSPGCPWRRKQLTSYTAGTTTSAVPVLTESVESPLGVAGGGFPPESVKAAIRASWSFETCDPTDAAQWSPANPSRGQCAVTALVMNDLFGGELLEAEVHFRDGSRQGFHYWNRLDGVEVDLTREQFSGDEVIQEPQLIDRRPELPWLAQEQYLVFRQRVHAALGSAPGRES